jgi:hypothetical protein
MLLCVDGLKSTRSRSETEDEGGVVGTGGPALIPEIQKGGSECTVGNWRVFPNQCGCFGFELLSAQLLIWRDQICSYRSH